MPHISKNILLFFNKTPLTYPLWFVGFTTLIATRVFSEYWMEGFSQRDPLFLFYEFTHTFLFFLLAYIIFLVLFMWFFRSNLQITATLLLYGFLITLFPSIWDHFFPVQGKFYDLQGLSMQFITFFSSAPHITVTHGARIEIALVVIGIMAITYLIKKNILHSLLMGFLVYCIFFMLGTMASIVTILIKGLPMHISSVTALDVAQLFLSPAHFFSYSISNIVASFNAKMSLLFTSILLLLLPVLSLVYFRKQTLSLLGNMRIPQLIYHGGLFCLGGLLAIIFTKSSPSFSFFNTLSFFISIGSIFFAWFTTIVINDIYDRKIDAISNPSRPLIKKVFTLDQYKMLGWTFFGTSLLLSLLISFSSALLLLGYHILAWIYSAWPLRLKRFPIIATFTSAFASVFILLIGYFLLSGASDISDIPVQIFIILLLGYTLALPVKDIKDIQGDKKDSVYTIPVLFGNYTGRVIIGSGLFFSYLLSVWVLNEPSLWIWSFLFGIYSYMTITTNYIWYKMKVSNRNIPFVALLLVFLYGIIMISTFA